MERRDATDKEVAELRHVVDSVPFIVWVALVANGMERFTFYAVTTPWREFEHLELDIIQRFRIDVELTALQRITCRIMPRTQPCLVH